MTRHARSTGAVRSLGLLLALVACGPRPGREIRIGLLASLQGDYAETSGIPSLEGARLAIDEVNSSGGGVVDGRVHQLVLVERHHDMRGDAAASAARASINLDRVDVLVGPQLSAAAQADGAFIVHQWHPDVPLRQSVAFVAAYKTRYGSSPRTTAALTHDAIHLVADAIARAGQLDGGAIADAIAATARFDGASGMLRFEGRHDPDRTAVLSTISQGSHRLVRIVGAAQ